MKRLKYLHLAGDKRRRVSECQLLLLQIPVWNATEPPNSKFTPDLPSCYDRFSKLEERIFLIKTSVSLIYNLQIFKNMVHGHPYSWLSPAEVRGKPSGDS